MKKISSNKKKEQQRQRRERNLRRAIVEKEAAKKEEAKKKAAEKAEAKKKATEKAEAKKKAAQKSVDLKKISIFHALVDQCHNCPDNVKSSINPNYITLMDKKHSIRCTLPGCNNNVRYSDIRENLPCCRNCSIKCCSCGEICHPDDMAIGLYSRSCIDCTRCEYCNIPMWDYECSCQVRR